MRATKIMGVQVWGSNPDWGYNNLAAFCSAYKVMAVSSQWGYLIFRDEQGALFILKE